MATTHRQASNSGMACRTRRSPTTSHRRAAMSTVMTQPQQPVAVHETTPPVVYVYSHSPLYYWWPVWLLGFVMALLTSAQGVHTEIGDSGVAVWMHKSRSLGVVYTIV